jgi:diguanylate cyclase (GGDEF)-like protein/PAS domain S-box-containing protein
MTTANNPQAASVMNADREFPETSLAQWDERVIRQVLEGVAEAVYKGSPYRRVVVSLYEHPLSPSSKATSRVVEYAARGLAPQDEREILLFLANGGLVSGEKLQPRFRVGQSYYIPAGSAPRAISPWIPSHRRFVRLGGWQADDLLLVPLEVNGQVIGQISVDDPRDGARPSPAGLRGLEEVACMAAFALLEATHLERLTGQHKLLSFLAENVLAGLAIIQSTRFCYVNDKAAEVLGYSAPELLAMEPWWQLIHPEDRATCVKDGATLLTKMATVRGIRKDGGVLWLSLEGRPMDYRDRDAVLLNLSDVSDKIETERLLKERALRDPLTGLFNRYYFDDTIQGELSRSKRYKRPFTLMLSDVAGFKVVNDRLGHQEGDRVLRELARLLRDQLRESDWAIRYGGDEFLMVLPETGTGVEALAQRLQAAVGSWAEERVKVTPLGIDLGWATWTPECNLSIPRLLEIADTRLYEAKAARHAGALSPHQE